MHFSAMAGAMIAFLVLLVAELGDATVDRLVDMILRRDIELKECLCLMSMQFVCRNDNVPPKLFHSR
jgi:hypothetical protein